VVVVVVDVIQVVAESAAQMVVVSDVQVTQKEAACVA